MQLINNALSAIINKLNKNYASIKIISLGFLAIIIIGTFLLILPISSKDGKYIDFIDAFFTATSSVCVTGLVSVSTFDQWSNFGKLVILILIQTGGIGIITLVAMIFIFFGKKITLKERLLIQHTFNIDKLSGSVKLVKYVILNTVIIEFIGAILIMLVFWIWYDMPFLKSFWYGIFHSVSAFCNAGFDILGNSSLIDFSSNYFLNSVIMLLIILGGIGFTVWIDIAKTLEVSIKEKRISKLTFANISVNTKITLIVSFYLITIFAIFIFLVEYNNTKTIGNFSFFDKIFNSLFQSVTLRTAGFASIDQAEMTYATKFISVMLMFVGGSSGGTAGGIKTVTLAVIVLAVISVINSKNNILVFRKTIPFNILQKALCILFLNFGLIVVSTTILTITEKQLFENFEFLDILFETTSAVSTVGLTTGITTHLSSLGKFIIIICMFIGRIGSITAVFSLTKKSKESSANCVQYPDCRVMIG